MRRFYCPSRDIHGSQAVINSMESVHHISAVLRMREGGAIIVFDDSGNEYECVIKKTELNRIILSVSGRIIKQEQEKRGFTITVACALPKKSAMDDIVDRLTQLGVDRIIPMITERVVSRPDKQALMRKWQRWEKIAISAVQQSCRNRIPVVEKACGFNDVLPMTAAYDVKLIPTLEGQRRHISEFASAPRDAGKLIFLIGPEGDFSPQESARAQAAGFIPVSLGSLVLRVDTAAVALAGFFHLLDISQD